MDITVIRTFLEVSATGSFVSAAQNLFVTQSAVSLRIQRLEDELGQPLFVRSRAGAELTPSGIAFERYANSMLKLWEEARQQLAVPEGFETRLCIGAEASIWPRLGFGWLDRLRRAAPRLSLRAELGTPDRLTRLLNEGAAQIALTHVPQRRPRLEAEVIHQEELVLVSTEPDPAALAGERYVLIDWGPDFMQSHALHYPALTRGGFTLALEASARDYILSRRLAGYLPAHMVEADLRAGRLHVVPGARRFDYPVWAVWRDDLPADTLGVALLQLKAEAAMTSPEPGTAATGDVGPEKMFV